MQRHGSMNHIFKLVWSDVLGAWVAVAESSCGRGKGARRKLAATALALTALHAQAGPAGGQVVAGTGSVSRAGALTTITQSSQNLALNWQSFNVAAQETVNFVQPSASAIAVNRIFDTNGSQILGRINANGNVYLINPNGILFGQGAQVNVGGLVASTLDLNGAGLESAGRSFSGSSEAAVVNLGTVTAAQGGHIAFLGRQVINKGTLSAPGGSVVLAGGNATTLTFQDNSLVGVQVDRSVLDTLAENGGLIRADGGRVVLTAGARDSLLASAVNHTGAIQARTVESRGGEIILFGGMAAGTVNVGGTLDAGAPGGGDGGFIETSGARVRIADSARLTTAAPAGRAGTWLVDPVDFTIAASGGDISGATLSANLAGGNVVIQSTSGAAGTGGDVNVNDAVAWNANTLTLSAQRDINVNANLNGSGSASLALEYGQAAVAAGNTGKSVVRATVNLPAGQNYSTRLGSDGVVKNYTVITSLGVAADAVSAPTTATLQGMAATANLATNYALGSDISAAATSSWNGNTGFKPIGNAGVQYSGSFDGLGHDITSLSLRPSSGLTNTYVGLFGWTSSSAEVRNVGVVNVGISHSVESRTGGLIGRNDGKVVNSYATGSVLGNTFLGGLVGHNSSTGTITESYYVGTARAGNRVGGIAGVNEGNISNSYSTGSVSSKASQDLVGGLVGSNSGTIVNSFAASTVSQASSDMGALVGGNSGTISNSRWDTGVSAIAGVGSGSAAGATGLSTAQMKQQANFGPWDFSTVWLSQDGLSYPLLRAYLTPLTVTANSISKPYNGQAYNGSGGVSYSVQPNGSLVGTLNYGSASQNVLNAGGYAIMPGGLYSTQQGYLINYVSGTLTVTPAVVNLSAARAYDGGAGFAAASFGAAGVIGTGIGAETLLLSGGGTVAGKDVGAGVQPLDLGTLALASNTGQLANYTLVGGTHTGQVTAKALTGSVTAPGKTYDGTTTASPSISIASGLVGAEIVTATGTATFNSKNVAQASVVTVNSVTLADGANGGLASNYSLAPGQTTAATIARAELPVTGLAAQGRTYDATAAATLIGTAVIARFGNDDVALGGTAVGAFADKNVGAGKAVTVTGHTLSGTDAGNYNLVQQAGLIANVVKADLAVSGLAASNKSYDATTTATLTGAAAISKLGSDDVAIAGAAAGVFVDKNVGTGKTVIVTGNTLSGNDAGNYNLIQQAGLVANVSKADLSVSGLAASNKIYDATTAATLTGTAAIAKLGSDDVAIAGLSVGVFGDKNVGTGKTVIVTGNTLSGTEAGNYNLIQQAGLVANVSKADLTVSGLAASNKTYDATTAAPLTGTAAISKLGSDDVALGGTAAGTFADKNVGAGKSVTVAGNTLLGADAGNYSLIQQGGLVANIAKADLTVSGLVASNKTYDATTTATLTGAGAISKLGNDDVALGGTAAGVFVDKNVGLGKTVVVSGNTLAGTDAGNYNLIQQHGLLANVAKADLAVRGLVANNKTYDATSAAMLTGTAAITRLGSDDVALAGRAAGVFADKNVGTGKSITVAGNTLSGPDAGNYNLVQQSGLAANIAKADLTVSGLAASNKIYDATTAATVTGAAAISKIGGDDVTLAGTAAGVFADKNVGTGKSITVAGNILSGTDAGNYNLIQQTGLVANIAKADLTVSGLAVSNKIYDATTTALLTGTAAISKLGSDDVALGGVATGNFVDKNVGARKSVTVTGKTLSGTDAGNYNLIQQAGLVANISKADLAVSGLAATNKIYDATTAATLTGAAAISKLGADDVALGGTASGSFDDKNVGAGKPVAVTGNILSGSDAGNYNLIQQPGLVANVAKADLTVSGLAAGNKVYDATTAATLTGTAAISKLGGDDVTLGGKAAGTFADKNAGAAKTVIVSGNTLSGADASNYNLVQQPALMANVAKADLVVSGLRALDKVYDATTAAPLTGQATVATFGNDIVVVGGTATGVFASKNVGTAKTVSVTVTGNILSGADAANYALVQQPGLSASVTKADLLVGGLRAVDKIYDGTSVATVAGTAAFDRLGADDVGFTITGAAFDDKNVGSTKAVTLIGATLTGVDAGNYRPVTPVGLTAAITKADLAVRGQSALDKVYDATISATLAGNASVSALAGDLVALVGSASATFDTQNVGSAKAVTVGGYSLTGADAGNYRLVQQTGLHAAVTPATLTYTANPVAVLVGRTADVLSGSVSGFAAADTLAQSTSGMVSWTTPAGAASGIGSYPVSGGGLAAPNYVFVQAVSNAGALSIGPALLPQPVADVTAQLLASVRPIGTGAQASASSAAPMIPGVGTSVAFRARGTTLQLVNGGTRLPDDVVNKDE